MTIQRERFDLYVVGFLLLITVAALLLQSVQLTKTLTIDSHTRYPYEAVDDHANGGLSQASLEIVGNTILLHCEIISSSYEWPYCEVSFNLAKTGSRGVDFSQYSSVRLWVKYDPLQDVGIRFQGRNFNSSYSHVDDNGSLKYNSIEFYGKKTTYPVEIPLINFQVPTWWLIAKEIPLDKTGTDFSNIVEIDIATGSSIKSGKYTIIVEKIEFVGKYISDQNLYLLLLIIWGASALFYFINKIHLYRQELYQSGHRQQELEALNRLLNVNRQRLEDKLIRDPLTGILNRDGIANLFENTSKSPTPIKLSIIFIDIDHFKKINDNYGHNVGDEVLIQFATTLTENTRDIDVLARWGGEEFILACPNTELLQAVILAEKLRGVITNCQWPQQIAVTASFGVAEMGNESPTDFIGRADIALYNAKTNGRNRVEVSKSKVKGGQH